MDKKKLLNSLYHKRTNWNESLKSSYETFIRNQEGVKLLTDIITEIENNEEDKFEELPTMATIINGMGTYCNMFNGKCSKCYFNIANQLNPYDDNIRINETNIYCAFDMIKKNVENPAFDYGAKEEK